MKNDRPPIQGVVGRESGQIRLTVCDNTQQATIQPQVEKNTEQKTHVHTDESLAYVHVNETGRKHSKVNHSKGEWARMMMVMVFVKFIAIRTKVSVQGCSTFCALFKGYTRSIYLSILRYLSGRTISNGSYQNS